MKVNVAPYRKFVAAIAGVVAVVAIACGDGSIDLAEAGQIGSAVVAAAAVFGFRNAPLDEAMNG